MQQRYGVVVSAHTFRRDLDIAALVYRVSSAVGIRLGAECRRDFRHHCRRRSQPGGGGMELSSLLTAAPFMFTLVDIADFDANVTFLDVHDRAVAVLLRQQATVSRMEPAAKARLLRQCSAKLSAARLR